MGGVEREDKRELVSDCSDLDACFPVVFGLGCSGTYCTDDVAIFNSRTPPSHSEGVYPVEHL